MKIAIVSALSPKYRNRTVSYQQKRRLFQTSIRFGVWPFKKNRLWKHLTAVVLRQETEKGVWNRTITEMLKKEITVNTAVTTCLCQNVIIQKVTSSDGKLLNIYWHLKSQSQVILSACYMWGTVYNRVRFRVNCNLEVPSGSVRGWWRKRLPQSMPNLHFKVFQT